MFAHLVIHAILVEVPGAAHPKDVGDLAECHVQICQHLLDLSSLNAVADVLGGAPLAREQGSRQPLRKVPVRHVPQ